MFIEIDDSCIEKINIEEKYITFFNRLAYEIYNGKNYYYLSKKILEYLYKESTLDNQPKEIYKKMFNSCYEDYAIKNTVKRKILIVNNKNIDFIYENGVYILELDVFIEIGLPNKMNIIAENNSDCKFFYSIGNAYKYKENLTSVNIEFTLVPGGGSTIVDTYRNKIGENDFSVLFVDSDKKYKGAPFGDTIKKLKNERKQMIQNGENVDFIEIKELDVHEIENLIPLSLIENYYLFKSEETSKQNVIDFLKKFELQKFDFNNPIVFFDMKKGIIQKKCEDCEDYKKYWENVYNSIGYTFKEDNLINGFGDHLLRKINNYLEKNVETEDFWNKNINQYIDDIWKDIGEIIYSYGCARTRTIC